MSDAVITTLISSGFLLLGTIITSVFSIINSKNSKQTKDTISSVKQTLEDQKATLKEQGEKLDAQGEKLDEHIKDEEFKQAKQARIRILRFNDEICAGVRFSENHYEDIIEDIDEYEHFCASHPDYHNNKGKIAMENIKAVYCEKKKNNKF